MAALITALGRDRLTNDKEIRQRVSVLLILLRWFMVTQIPSWFTRALIDLPRRQEKLTTENQKSCKSNLHTHVSQTR
eukprot:TRINITY_DN17507_c0_g1_i1.p1 TRINITY_DN17507_c0_g1~~TRINITY_DN17507_c0_g1_i1.p1  ORF type:complete len:77 (+),score=4.77 TRINITY_DN17507_c0_g1_i1:321-551(+)